MVWCEAISLLAGEGGTHWLRAGSQLLVWRNHSNMRHAPTHPATPRAVTAITLPTGVQTP